MDRPHKLAQFTPLRRASALRYALLYTLGPLLWVAAIVAVSLVVHRGDAVDIALIVLGGSLVFSLAILLPMRWGRVRRDREG